MPGGMTADLHAELGWRWACGAHAFVGRECEMATLNGALRDAESGHGRLLLIAGEPGIGKTRLAAEFATAARHDGAVVLWGGCYDGEWAPPFGPFAEAIAAYARQGDVEMLRADLGFGAAPIARVVLAVRERLPDLPEPVALQPDEERFRLLDAVSQFLIAVTRRTPVVLVLDDLHWADKGTIAMLRHVARFAPQHHLLLLGTYRDIELDARHPLTHALGALYRETACKRVQLKGLGAAEVAQLVDDSEVPAERRDAVTDQINAVTNGNPFFVREVLQHLVEEQQITREPSDGNGKTVDRVAVPDSVRQVLNRRVWRLSTETGCLLSAAAAAAEYGAEFRRDIESFVSREAVDAVVVQGRHELAPRSAVEYVAFVDPSGGSQDSMTLAIAHRENDRAVLDCVRERRPPFNPSDVVAEFVVTLNASGSAR